MPDDPIDRYLALPEEQRHGAPRDPRLRWGHWWAAGAAGRAECLLSAEHCARRTGRPEIVHDHPPGVECSGPGCAVVAPSGDRTHAVGAVRHPARWAS